MFRSLPGVLAVLLPLQFASTPALARIWVTLEGARHGAVAYAERCLCAPHHPYSRSLARNFAAYYYQSPGGVGRGHRALHRRHRD